MVSSRKLTSSQFFVMLQRSLSYHGLALTRLIYEYISPTTTKQIFDRYQKTHWMNLWSSHYEKMQENLGKLKEVNRENQEGDKKMRQGLNDLSFQDLRNLEKDIESASKVIIHDRAARYPAGQLSSQHS